MSSIQIPHNRWVGFTGKIDEASISGPMEKISNLHQLAPNEPICLFLSSGGGSCRAGFAFYEFISYVLKPIIYTVVLAEVGSMAIPMFLVGSKRFMTKNSTLYFHELGRTFSSDERLSTSEISNCLSDLSVDQQRYEMIVTERSEGKVSVPELISLMKGNTNVYAEHAVELGLAHSVLD